MASLLLSLICVLLLLFCEWFYFQKYFKYIEPSIIDRTEKAFDIKIGFGVAHHWEVRQINPEITALNRMFIYIAIFAIQFVTILFYIIGLILIIGIILSPLTLFNYINGI